MHGGPASRCTHAGAPEWPRGSAPARHAMPPRPATPQTHSSHTCPMQQMCCLIHKHRQQRHLTDISIQQAQPFLLHAARHVPSCLYSQCTLMHAQKQQNIPHTPLPRSCSARPSRAGAPGGPGKPGAKARGRACALAARQQPGQARGQPRLLPRSAAPAGHWLESLAALSALVCSAKEPLEALRMLVHGRTTHTECM